jgi:hypothetical protein
MDEDSDNIVAVESPINGDIPIVGGATSSGGTIAEAISGAAASAASKLLPRRRSNTKVKRKSKMDVDMEGNGTTDAVAVDGKAGKNSWSAVVKEIEKPGRPGEVSYEIELTEGDGEDGQKIVESIVCLACLRGIE